MSSSLGLCKRARRIHDDAAAVLYHTQAEAAVAEAVHTEKVLPFRSFALFALLLLLGKHRNKMAASVDNAENCSFKYVTCSLFMQLIFCCRLLFSCAHSLPPLELERRARALFSNEATFAGRQYVCAVLPSLLTRHCWIQSVCVCIGGGSTGEGSLSFLSVSLALPLSLWLGRAVLRRLACLYLIQHKQLLINTFRFCIYLQLRAYSKLT